MEDVKIKEWLEDNLKNSGYGYGSGSGDGYGDGSGYGDGYGDGFGSGCGSGFGSGFGYEFDNGCGRGFGYGCGSGNGYGSGYGYCFVYGPGPGYDDDFGNDIKTFGNDTVYMIDSVQTVIKQIKGQVAKGFILNKDFTLEPCYIVKGNGYFAHGKDIREAQSSLREKIFEDMDSEEAIEKFLETFELDKSYKGTEFFEWHHYLTGSCLMGREQFVKDHGLDLEREYTVQEFIELTENSYGGHIIKQLKRKGEEKL